MGEGLRTVLVVEDDVWLRRMLERVLRKRGFHVLSADNSDDALDHAENAKAVDLLITDVMFPGDGVRALVEGVRRHHPELEVLVVSGYDLDGAEELDGLGVTFLAKPFTPSQLDERVREVLGAPITVLGKPSAVS